MRNGAVDSAQNGWVVVLVSRFLSQRPVLSSLCVRLALILPLLMLYCSDAGRSIRQSAADRVWGVVLYLCGGAFPFSAYHVPLPCLAAQMVASCSSYQ
jgi:hypothetical protein